MKLDDFLKEDAFKRHAKNIDSIRSEFIAEGCELFLWTTFREQQEAWKYTDKIKNKSNKFECNNKVKNFLEQFDNIDFNTEVAFFYPEDFSPNFLIANEIAKTAKKRYVINNIFEEDDGTNYIAIFDKTDINYIGMMSRVVCSIVPFTSDSYGGYKLFNKGLLYFYDCLEYEGHMLLDSSHKFAHFQGNQFRRDTNPYILLESRKITKMLIQLGYFLNEFEIFHNFQEVLLPFFQNNYENITTLISGYNKNWNNEIESLKSDLVSNGIISSKWKSEQTLFTMIKRIYPDALFQHRLKWLEPQNLDIYIPSINVGIEYQGIQHYEPVDFFGGNEAFKHRKELDERKRQLCVDNHLKLVEWKYTEDISKKVLQKKLL